MNTKQRKKIRELKLTNPKKYIRLKYILYYFPFLKEDNNRINHLLDFFEFDKFDFGIWCKESDIIPFFYKIDNIFSLNFKEENKVVVRVDKFFEYFGV
jgi:hypothetical protein